MRLIFFAAGSLLAVALPALAQPAPIDQGTPALEAAGSNSQTLSLIGGSLEVTVSAEGAASVHSHSGTVAGEGGVGLEVNGTTLAGDTGAIPAIGGAVDTAAAASAADRVPAAGNCPVEGTAVASAALLRRIPPARVSLLAGCAAPPLGDAQHLALAQNAALIALIERRGYRLADIVGAGLVGGALIIFVAGEN
jgi:hypothetical protein